MNNNLYEGLFYCTQCGKPKHIIHISNKEPCECGKIKFISHLNFDLETILQKKEEYI